MPRYSFDLFDDVDAIDTDGKEFPDLAAAKALALVDAREMMQASISEHGKIDLRHRLYVRDDSGAVVYVLHFEDGQTRV